MADVRDGLGPYLSIYLKSGQHWPAGRIGVAMAASSIAAAVFQIPGGLLVDKLTAKRSLVAASGSGVAVGCLLIVAYPAFFAVIAAQILIGAASAIIPPALAALSLGLVGRAKLDARISRNEGFNHGGNFAAATLAGGLGQHFGYHWIFYLVCAFAAGSAAVVNLINPREINYELARGGEESLVRTASLISRWHFCKTLQAAWVGPFPGSPWCCSTSACRVHAAMLPMAGQVLAKTHPGSDVIALSACIIAAQLVMIGVAAAVGAAMKALLTMRPTHCRRRAGAVV